MLDRYETKHMKYKPLHRIIQHTYSGSNRSWLGPSIPDARVELPNFQALFRRDRNENGGGVCTYLSNNREVLLYVGID